jgi:hypothetical protein
MVLSVPALISGGGFFGLSVGRGVSGNTSGIAWGEGFILSWMLFIAGIFMASSIIAWHTLSFVCGAVSFFAVSGNK